MVSPTLQRTKLLAILLAAATTLASAVVLFAGGATASQWHQYEGDLHPGHAYGLDVPAGAETIEISFVDAGDGAAKLAVFDPSGDVVGHYALGASPSAASIASPDEGRYVLYVYEVTRGALGVRVSASEAPATLELTKIPLAREDLVLKTSDGPAPLDEILTAKIQHVPVFVTLLYQGSVENLDATVASAKGEVVTIRGESGTAFSPGVWSALSGERVAEPANLASGVQTITARADRFEGTLVLTALVLDTATPVAPETEVPVPVAPEEPGLFALQEGHAVAFTAPATKLVLADPAWLKDQQEDTDEHHWGRHYGDSLVSLYTPDDELLAVVELHGDHPYVEIDLPVAGEYVAYVAHAGRDGLVGKLAGTSAPPALRELELREEIHAFQVNLVGWEGYEAPFTLEHAPVEMRLHALEDSLGALSHAEIHNEHGVVAGTDSFVHAPYLRITQWSYQDRALFTAGEHLLRVGGVAFSGTLELTAISYVREAGAVVVEEPVEEAADEEGGDAGGRGLQLPDVVGYVKRLVMG